MKNLNKKSFVLGLLVCLIIGLFPINANAASFKYKYNGKTYTYTGVQPTVKYNNKKISLSKTPAMLVNDVAMVPYYEVFVKNGPKAKKSYNSSTKKLVITYNDTKITMTVGSKTAYVNGSKVTLPVAPRKVKYTSSGLTRILVPSRKIATYLGLTYDWNSNSKVISMTGQTVSNTTSSATTTSTKGTYYLKGVKKTATKCTVSFEGTTINTTKTPAFVINNVAMAPYYTVFHQNGPKTSRTYSSKTKILVLTYNGNTLTMKVGSKSATLNGAKVSLDAAPISIEYKKNSTNYILVPVKSVATYLGITYNFDSSSKAIAMAKGLSLKYDGSYRAYGGSTSTVSVNNTKVVTDMPAITIDGTLYIPGNAPCNLSYGLGVSYSYKSKKATFTDGITTVVMTIDSTTAVVNGTTKTMPAKARLVHLTKKNTNYVMIPVDYFCSLFGLSYTSANGIVTLKPAEKVTSSLPDVTYTNYNTTLSYYAALEYNELSSANKSKYTLAAFTNYIKTESDTTDHFKYLRLDTYRPMNTTSLDELIASNAKGATGVLNGQAKAINNAAKKYNIDPVAFAMQCIHETGWGTSTLAKGITSKVVAIPIYNSKGEVTNFEKDAKGNYITKELDAEVTAYNLFGIKAYDSAANLCAFSYAYYNKWTSIEAAIEGGAKYISENYIHHATYKQNTFYKFRFNPNTSYIWHQYATDPGYAEKTGTYLKNYKYIYSSTATFQYDYPKFND